MILTSPNHYNGRDQNLSVLTNLAGNEKRPSLFIPSLSKDIYPLQSPFEPARIFLFLKKTLLGSHPTLGANKRYFEDTDRIN